MSTATLTPLDADTALLETLEAHLIPMDTPAPVVAAFDTLNPGTLPEPVTDAVRAWLAADGPTEPYAATPVRLRMASGGSEYEAAAMLPLHDGDLPLLFDIGHPSVAYPLSTAPAPRRVIYDQWDFLYARTTEDGERMRAWADAHLAHWQRHADHNPGLETPRSRLRLARTLHALVHAGMPAPAPKVNGAEVADVVDGLRDVANDLAQIADLLATAVERVCDRLPDDDEPEPPTDGPALLRAATARTRAEGDARRALAADVAEVFGVPDDVLTAPSVTDGPRADRDETWGRIYAHAAELADQFRAAVRPHVIGPTSLDAGSGWRGLTARHAVVVDEAPDHVWAPNVIATRFDTGLLKLHVYPGTPFLDYASARDHLESLWDGALDRLCQAPTVRRHDGHPSSWARVPACGTPAFPERPTVATLARAVAQPVRYQPHPWPSWRPRHASSFAPARDDESARPLADRLPFAAEPAHDVAPRIVRGVRWAQSVAFLRRVREAVGAVPVAREIVVSAGEYAALREAAEREETARPAAILNMGGVVGSIPIRFDVNMPPGVVRIEPAPTRAATLLRDLFGRGSVRHTMYGL